MSNALPNTTLTSLQTFLILLFDHLEELRHLSVGEKCSEKTSKTARERLAVASGLLETEGQG